MVESNELLNLRKISKFNSLFLCDFIEKTKFCNFFGIVLERKEMLWTVLGLL